jgi:ribonuclease HII
MDWLLDMVGRIRYITLHLIHILSMSSHRINKSEKACRMQNMATKSSHVIAGIDEAGRGALAGPVVAGCCYIPCHLRVIHTLPFMAWKPVGTDISIADSKKLQPLEREKSFKWINEECPYGIGVVAAKEIDECGILEATHNAMQIALTELQKDITPTVLFIDGRDKFFFTIPKISIIKGDETEACIAAASILAKVIRDRLMTEYAQRFPLYGFESHKGYGTEYHRDAILKYGPCDIHRSTFCLVSNS